MDDAALSNPSPQRISRISLCFGALLFFVTAYFLFWGHAYTNGNHLSVFVLATLFGIFMAFNIGGNDVANSFGTSVGAGTLTIKQALLVAAVFEVSGAILAGGEVTSTIRKGIVDLSAVTSAPMDFVYIMMSALLAAAFWLLFASRKGYPVSTTHSIIGAIVGASLTLGILMTGSTAAFGLVKWDKILQIALSWVISPLLGGLMSYLLYGQIKKRVLHHSEAADALLQQIHDERHAHIHDHMEAFERLSEIQQMSYTHAMSRDLKRMAEGDVDSDTLESEYYRKLHAIEKKRHSIPIHKVLEGWVPLIAALGAMVIASLLLFKGLKHIHLGLTPLHNYLILGMIGVVVWLATFIFAKTLKRETVRESTFLLFSWMQVFTAAGFAFSHGSNDIANAIGPFAAILDVLRTGQIGSAATIPTLAMIAFGVALVVGLWFIGKEVIATVGHHLTQMHPASGFSAELAAASVVMGASLLGLPVSSTHILIGAVLGIGILNRQTNWGLMKPIAMAWIITLPVAALISAATFMMLRQLF